MTWVLITLLAAEAVKAIAVARLVHRYR